MRLLLCKSSDLIVPLSRELLLCSHLPLSFDPSPLPVVLMPPLLEIHSQLADPNSPPLQTPALIRRITRFPHIYSLCLAKLTQPQNAFKKQVMPCPSCHLQHRIR